MAALERRHVFYSGRVQGVGFRFTAQRATIGSSVTGWVKNLPDGRVELLVEGEPAEVQAYLARVAQRMAGNIDSTEEFVEPASGKLSGFNIKH